MSTYLDHNATTPLRPEVRAVWLAVSDELAGNPSSLHTGGRRARSIVDEARERVAAALGVDEAGVIFTSGGTEADNLAVLGVVGACGRPVEDAGVVTTNVEHSAVLEPARVLARRGHDVREVSVDEYGLADPEDVLAAATSKCVLVSVQAANNELGTISDIAAIGRGLRARTSSRPWLHTDAIQALGRLPVDLEGWGVDLASFSGHKVGGPVGVGVLVRRGNVPLEPLLYGGGQEGGLRPGTEDAAGIAATALAIELAVSEREQFEQHTRALSRELWGALTERRQDVRLLGPAIDDARRLPNTLTVLLPGLDGRVLVTRLDLAGLAVSAGSACASGSLEPSHVLRAIGLHERDARSGLRLSLGRSTTRSDCKRAAEILCATKPPSRAT